MPATSIRDRSLSGPPAHLLLPVLLILALIPRSAAAQRTDVDSIYRFGIQQVQDGDIDNAINTFRKVLEIDPNYAQAHSSLGYIYLQKENLELAQASFRRAIEIDEDLAQAWNGLGLVQGRAGGTRPQAIESFRTALRLDPEYLEAEYNLGVTLGQTEQYRLARQSLNAVQAKQPGFRDVPYQLGLLALRQKNYTEAENQFVEMYRLDPNNKENRASLGRVYFETQQYERAEEMLLPMITQYPDYLEPKLLLADVYLALEDYERANQLFIMSFRTFDDRETADRLWRDVVDIAKPSERKEYAATPLEKMADFFRRFWLKRDPDPTTDENEILVEHYRRLRHAREYFSTPTSPGGYDDRGRIYLRNGEPDTEVADPAGDAETRPSITWEYHTGRQERLIVHFVDRGNGYFQQVESLMAANMKNPLGVLPSPTEANPNEVPNVSELWVDSVPINLYRERAVIDPIFDRIANMMEELQRNAQGAAGGADVATTYQTRLESLLNEERFEILKDINTLETSENYTSVLPKDGLPFHFYTAAFRDIQGKTRIEVYYGIPTTELSLERYGDGSKATVELGISVYDADWNEEAHSNDKREFVSQTAVQQDANSAMVDMNRLVVDPGTYNFAISVKDPVSGRVGMFKDSLRVASFAGNKLSISDIEMAGQIEESRSGGRFYRDGLVVIPMPSRTYTTEQEIYIYYEAYNLAKDEFGTTQFQTSYSIQAADEGKSHNILSSAFRALGNLVGLGKSASVSVEGEVEYGIRATEVKHLQLAFPKPQPGVYEITLRIKDLNSGAEAERHQQFMITPPPR